MTPPIHTENPPGGAPDTPQTLTVSQLNRLAKRLLESHFDFLWIEGELSNLATPASGHWYFTLKDDRAQVRCAMFRNRNQRLRMRPQNGQLVRMRARVSLYEGRGEFQLIVEHLEDAGAGALQRAFEELKLKLQNEGLFDAHRKRALPPAPQHIAIISSRTGAAVRDIITVFRRRFPAIHLSLLPVAVQGLEAPPQIVAALDIAYDIESLDAIIVARGGGSAEDLAAFNDEALARKIVDSPVPVVSAVGHEIDFTIADFVADKRAPTPSAAAEMLSPDQRELAARLLAMEQALARQLRRQLQLLQAQLMGLRGRLRHPGERLREQAQRLDDLELHLKRALKLELQQRQHRLGVLASRLRGQSPADLLRQLGTETAHLATRARRALGVQLDRQRHALALLETRLTAISPQQTLERGYAIVLDSEGALV
ncbi:MAG: exodeoxyribonuclease VII large subunit, partial [Halieaceae bacterium]|nr:exodeoxyribonuclease VII large subunit [Halieaceae bacterium]